MKRALVVWGGMELHTPERGAQVVRALLEAEGFAVTVTDDYEALGAADIGTNDLVVDLRQAQDAHHEVSGKDRR